MMYVQKVVLSILEGVSLVAAEIERLKSCRFYQKFCETTSSKVYVIVLWIDNLIYVVEFLSNINLIDLLPDIYSNRISYKLTL